MDLLNRLRIGTKISAVILVVLVLIGLVAGMGMVSLNRAYSRLNYIVDASVEKVNLASTLGRNLIEVVRAEKNIILAENSSELETYQLESTERLSKITECRAALETLSEPDELALLEQFEEHWQDYVALNQHVRQLALDGQAREAVELSCGAAREAVNAELVD